MKVAIMQPYLFPYIGYFQLINAVDKFVIYDDVNYIMRGWINRNYILVNGKKTLFTVPLKKASQNKLIKDIDIVSDSKWKINFLKTLRLAYGRAPFFKDGFYIIEEIINSNEKNLSKFIYNSIMMINKKLSITTDIMLSSWKYRNTDLKGKDRIIDICKIENATYYINPIGGQTLYKRSFFEKNGIILKFVRTKEIYYTQYKYSFIPTLSIIDLLMFNSIERVQHLLNEYELV